MAGQNADGNLVERLTGLAGSRGLEYSPTGRITKHLSAIFTYAYTDARTLGDTKADEGRQLVSVPKNAGSAY